MKLKLKSRNPSMRLVDYLKEHHHDMTNLIRWDHLDHLAERHGIAVKDIWAELQSNQPLSCDIPKFKEKAMEAVERIVARQKEQVNGVGG